MLPGRDRAYVSPAKIDDDLLSLTHPVGRHKAAFFLSHGFSADAGQALAEALLRHADEHVVRHGETLEFGIKYVIDGISHTPDGRSPVVRSVWIIEPDQTSPRLVTADPGPKPS
jgi:hypothetical protein